MPDKRIPTIKLLILMAAIGWLLSACGGSQTPDEGAFEQGTFAIDSLFRSFYNRLGGEEVLGPAISEVTTTGSLQIQYTAAGLLVYDSQASGDQRFSLSPIGNDLGYSDPPNGSPTQEGEYRVDGHVLYSPFLTLYEQLGGKSVVGSALTDVRYNAEHNRFEQFFENLGFYLLAGDDPENVGLLAYGVFNCGPSCSYRPPIHSEVEQRASLPEPFASMAARLGTTFTGPLLAGPYRAADGNSEVIFENLVLYVNPEDPSRAYARPIVRQIGFEPQPLAERINSPVVYFFEMEDGKGHNIPVRLNSYIAFHGSLDIAGLPISEVFAYGENVYRQCFENLCLDYYPNADPLLQIRPAPLGTLYKAQNYNQIEQNSQEVSSIRLNVWLESPQVTSEQTQTIYISVFENETPQANLQATITLTLPDGSQSFYLFPTTDLSGNAQLTVPKVLASNGTLVPFVVCIENIGPGGRICEHESYLIWGNP